MTVDYNILVRIDKENKQVRLISFQQDIKDLLVEFLGNVQDVAKTIAIAESKSIMQIESELNEPNLINEYDIRRVLVNGEGLTISDTPFRRK